MCSQAGLEALASLLSRELQVEEHLLQLLAALAMLVQVAPYSHTLCARQKNSFSLSSKLLFFWTQAVEQPEQALKLERSLGGKLLLFYW